ncbi:MAG: EAL domain-containing protein [Ilumatobacteraceae bacterium]
MRDEQLLRRAIERSDVEPYYQPLVDATTGRVVGAELLCRWHRDGHVVPAGAFIALAEETGLIDSLSERMIERGLADLRAWEQSGVLGAGSD